MISVPDKSFTLAGPMYAARHPSTRTHLASFCAGERDNGKALYQQNNSLKNEMCASGPKAGNSAAVKLDGFYGCLMEGIGNGADQPKKKGRISSPTLWALARVNQCTGVSASDSLGGFSRRSLRNASNANCTGRKSGAECEGFGFLPILQPSGSDLGFLRCSDLSLRPQASSTHAEKLAPGSSAFSRSTLASISATTLCGNRIPLYVVLLVIWALDISLSHQRLNKSENTAKRQFGELFKQLVLTCLNNVDNLFKQGAKVSLPEITKPGSGGTLTGPLTKPLIGVTVMAGSQHTQTHPKYQYRFLALNRHDKKARPCRLSVEAATESEARRILAPHFILSLAARLPVREVRHA